MEMTRTTFIRLRSDTIGGSASYMFDLAVVYMLNSGFLRLQPPNEVLIWSDMCEKQTLAGIIRSAFVKLRHS